MKQSTMINIALADDHNIVRRGICEIISSFGMFNIIIEANNGKELLDSVSKLDEMPDIIILDVSMPKMDGYDTLIAIKKKWPDTKVLILTMFNNEFSIIRMLRSGANGYMLKSANPNELEEALMAIYEKGIYCSDIVSNHIFHVMHQSTVMPGISEKEKQLLQYSHTDLTYEEIAKKMGVTGRSVEGYRDNLFQKLSVNSRPGLVLWAIKLGIVPIEW